MFNKFEAFMNKWLMPIAQKVDKQRHLSAIKASMVAMTPFTILGSFFAIIPALPNMIGENNAFSQFILNNAELLDLPVTLSIGMMSVYVTMCIAYNLGITTSCIFRAVSLCPPLLSCLWLLKT